MGCSPKSRPEQVMAGIPVCRKGRHLAVRGKRRRGETPEFNLNFPGGDAIPSGWKPRLHVSQNGRRNRFQTGSAGK